MPPDKPSLTVNTVDSIAVRAIPVHPGHAGLVEHDNSDGQLKEFPPGDPSETFNKKLATYIR